MQEGRGRGGEKGKKQLEQEKAKTKEESACWQVKEEMEATHNAKRAEKVLKRKTEGVAIADKRKKMEGNSVMNIDEGNAQSQEVNRESNLADDREMSQENNATEGSNANRTLTTRGIQERR